MNLSIIIPARRRWWWLKRQAAALASQLGEGDRVIIIVDNDEADARAVDEINQALGRPRLTWMLLSYSRGRHPVACVNRARNAAVCLAPADAAIVELDDHDLLEPYALSELRHAFEAGAEYVFGWHKQIALIERPDGRLVAEPWPTVKHGYAPGDFAAGRIDAIGVRAVTRQLWDALGGWRTDVWPCGDKDFAVRAERRGARIVCLEQPLCTVVANEPESLSYRYRGAAVRGRFGP